MTCSAMPLDLQKIFPQLTDVTAQVQRIEVLDQAAADEIGWQLGQGYLAADKP
jgi:hypothetical protein